MEATHQIPYKSIKYNINSKNINLFKFMESRRKIRETNVSKLHGMLQRGEHFQSPIVVNSVSGFYRIIDGNHRIEALNRFFSYQFNKSKSIDVNLCVYENLATNEEQDVYTAWNSGTQESMDDRLQIHKDKIVFWKNCQKDFPCKVQSYVAKDGIRFRNLLNLIYTVKNNNDCFTMSRLKKENLVEFADSVTYDDYLAMKGFFTFFQNVFGAVSTDNIYRNDILLFPIAHIFFRNKTDRKFDDLARRFEAIKGKATFVNFNNLRAREDASKVREAMLDYMNSGYKKDIFV